MTNLDKQLEDILSTVDNSHIQCNTEDLKSMNGGLAQIKSIILAELEKSMPKGYVAKDLDYKYIYYNQALTDCLEVIKEKLQ